LLFVFHAINLVKRLGL